MIRYGALVILLLFVNIPDLEGSECGIFEGAFKSYYQCILSCYKDVFGIAQIAGNLCSTDLELSGMAEDKFPISSIEDSIDCITARCRTAFPPSVCESATNQGGTDSTQGNGVNDGGTSTISGSSGTGGLSTSEGGNEEYEYEEYDCVEVDDDGQGGGGGGTVSDAGSAATDSSEEDEYSYYYSDEYYSDEDSSSSVSEETGQPQDTNVNNGGGNIQTESGNVLTSSSNNGYSGFPPFSGFFNFGKKQPAPALPSGSGANDGKTPVQSGNQEPINNQPLQPAPNNQAPKVTNTNSGSSPGRWWSWFSNSAPAVVTSNSGSDNGFVNSYDANANSGPIVNSHDATGDAGQNGNFYGSVGNDGSNGNNYGSTGNNGFFGNIFGNSFNQPPNSGSYGNNFGNSYDAIGNAPSYDNGGTAVASAAASSGTSNSFASEGDFAAPSPIETGNVGNDYHGPNPAVPDVAPVGNAPPLSVASASVGNDYNTYNPAAPAWNAPPPLVASPNVGNDYFGYNPSAFPVNAPPPPVADPNLGNYGPPNAAAASAATAVNAPPPPVAGPNLGNNYGPPNAAASAVATADTGPSNIDSINNMLQALSNNGAGNLGLQDPSLGPITLNFGTDRIEINGKQVNWHRNDQLINTFNLN